MKYFLGIVAAALAALTTALPALASTPDRVRVTGEIVDTWCYVTEIMYAEGTAHHQCAVW